MEKETWILIEKFVNDNLTNRIFEIKSDIFQNKFRLRDNFRDDLLEARSIHKPNFTIKTPDYLPEYPEGTFLIRFSKKT